MNGDLRNVYHEATRRYRRPRVSKRIELHGQAHTVAFLASGVDRTFLAPKVRKSDALPERPCE